jgi:hypothetical protein
LLTFTLSYAARHRSLVYLSVSFIRFITRHGTDLFV